LWYSQAGTPLLQISSQYDAAAQRYALTVKQSCRAMAGLPAPQALHIPLALGLVGADGQDLPLQLEGEDHAQTGTRVLDIKQAEQTFVFLNVAEEPVPSLLRGFSAPVKLEYDWRDEQLAF
jgi:aminopeptidase N